MFTGNSGVLGISRNFSILRCDGLSMLLTLGMSVISTAFVTWVFMFGHIVGVILLLDL